MEGSLQLFDFSERKQSNLAATLVPARRFGAASPDASPHASPHAEVLVTRVRVRVRVRVRARARVRVRVS